MDAKERKARYQEERKAAEKARQDEYLTRRATALRTMINAHRAYTGISDYADTVGDSMIGYWGDRKGGPPVRLHAARMVRDIVGESPNEYNIREYLRAWERIVQLQRMSRQS